MGVRICLGCLNEVSSATVRCPRCGFSLEDPVPTNALLPKTRLHNRYVIGKALKIDGEGISYAAYDLQTSSAALIREYMPHKLAYRSDDQVVANGESVAKYKALLSDFKELYLRLQGWQSLHNIRRVYDVFEENSTIYAACDYLMYMTLNQYLGEHAGQLDWDQAAELFQPVMESLLAVNRSGFIHRGLSPENIVVVGDGTLRLIGFSICSAKVVNSEIEHSLEHGYAAPEQYMVAQHGEWTDVYAMCAVLYKTLTGTCPPSAPTRAINDNLVPPVELNNTIPQNVSRAIMDGLRYDYTNRTNNMERLIEALYYSPVSPQGNSVQDYPNQTEYFDRTSYQAKQNNTESRMQWEKGEEEEEKPKKPIWLKVLLCSIPVVFVLCILLYQSIIGFSFFGEGDKKESSSTNSSLSSMTSDQSSSRASSSSSSSSEAPSSQVTKTSVNSFIGLRYSDIDTSTYKGKYGFNNPAYDYNSQVAAGYVCAQSIDEGTKVTADRKITLTISKGPKIIELPATSGMTPGEYAEKLLKDYDIPTDVQKEYSSAVDAGYITRIAPSSGSSYDRSSGAMVVIYKSMGPEPKVDSSTPESSPTAPETTP